MAPLKPIDPALFDIVAAGLTYAKLYPYIQADFMGKTDCKLVHTKGNMILNGSAGPVPVTGFVEHLLVKGGDDTVASGKKAEYKTKVKSGDLDFITNRAT